MSKKKHYIRYIIPIIGLLALLLALFYVNKSQREMSYNTFISCVEQGTVQKVVFSENENYLAVTLADSSRTYKVPNPKSEDFMALLLAHDIAVMYQGGAESSPLISLLLIAGIGGCCFYYRTNHRRKSLIQDASVVPATALRLNDIAGNEEAKAMVADIIDFIKRPEKYADMGARMPHGLLFYGPPGTGKTLLAKAIATEAGVPFYPMNGSDFIQMYVGVGASRIRDLFSTARKSEKAVIFIDEIDAIGKRRSARPDGGTDERDQTLNALLTEMSGFHERDGIVVIAATNRLDTLDEALTRPGRFDRLIEIGLPDMPARKKILELHVRSKPLCSEVDLDDLAKSTVSFSGAMLEHLLNEAAILAANADCSFINSEHIEKAFYTVIAGSEKSDTSCITPKDRRITAYHEAGHALITRLLLPDSYLSRVTIIPTTRGAGGFSLSIPKDSLYMEKHRLLSNIKVLLAGRASEELVFGSNEVTTGASSDIEKASHLIVDYVNKYGMDEELGLFNNNVLGASVSSNMTDVYRARIKELYDQTVTLLREHQQPLHNIAAALLEKETLNAQDMDMLC